MPQFDIATFFPLFFWTTFIFHMFFFKHIFKVIIPLSYYTKIIQKIKLQMNRGHQKFKLSSLVFSLAFKKKVFTLLTLKLIHNLKYICITV